MARPPTYHTDAEKPVSVSLRIPREVYDQVQRQVSQRRMTLTEALLDGVHLWLETPADPRDILVSQDNTVMQENAVALKQCKNGHAPYPGSKSECPTCVRERKQRSRKAKRQPQPA